MNIFLCIGQYIKRFPLSSLEALAIWVVCMIPIPETPLDGVAFIDKWTHFVMYGSLTLVIWCEYMYRHDFFRAPDRVTHQPARLIPVNMKRLLIGGFILPVIQGGVIELAQAYLTTCRNGDWFDFLCNSLGVLLGAGMGYLLMIVRKR